MGRKMEGARGACCFFGASLLGSEKERGERAGRNRERKTETTILYHKWE